MMKLIRYKGAAGRQPGKENRKGSLRGILGLALLVMFSAVLAAGGLGTRTYAENLSYDASSNAEEESDITDVDHSNTGTAGTSGQKETEKAPNINTNWNSTAVSSDEEAYAFIVNRVGQGNELMLTANGGTDLNKDKYIESAELKNGKGETISPDDEVVLGERYSYTVQFKEYDDEHQFKSPMTFRVPAGFMTRDVQNVPVEKDGVQVGTYSIKDGVVTFNIDEDYLNGHKDVWFKMTFNMTAVGTESGDTVEFPWTGGETETFYMSGQPAVQLNKKAGKYDPTKHTISYTVTLDVESGVVQNTEITDAMENGVSLLTDKDNKPIEYTITVTDENGDKLTLDPEPKLVKTDEGWKTENLPSPLVKGQKVTIEYEAVVDYDENGAKVTLDPTKDETPFHFDVENTAKVTCEAVNGEEKTIGGKTEDAEKTTIDDKQLEKDGTMAAGNGIDWEISVGSGSFDVRGAELTDTIEGDQWVDTEKPLEIKWKNSYNTIDTKMINWVLKDGKIDEEAMAKEGITNIKTDEEGRITGFDVKLPDKSDPFWENEGRTWQDGDWVKVEYYTKYNPPADGTSIPYTNKVSGFTEQIPPGVGEIVIGKGGIKKDLTGDVYDKNKEEDYIEYKLTVKVPPCDQLRIMKNEENKDAFGEDEYPYFYIKDELEFPTVYSFNDDGSKTAYRYFVDNVPEIIEMKASGASGSYTFTPYDYDERPYNNEHLGYTYTLVHTASENKDTREFEIWFNTNYQETAKNDYHDSLWPINEEVTLTITYRIPGDSKIVKEVNKDEKIYENTDFTLRELLEMGNRLDNEVWGKFRNDDGKELTTENQYTKTPENVSINKYAQLLKDNEIEYTVRFDNAYEDANGNDHDLHLFTNEEIDTFKFVDVFDSRLEYVSGSLEVIVLNAGGGVRGIFKTSTGSEGNGDLFSITENPETGKTTMSASAMAFDSVVGENGPYSRNSLYEWLWKHQTVTPEHKGDYTLDAHRSSEGNKDSRYIFRYRLKIKDEALNGEELTLDNTAHVKYGNEDLTDVEQVKTWPDIIEKKSEQIEVGGAEDGTGKLKSDRVKYTIVVNPSALNLATGTSTDGQTRDLVRYTLTDIMSDALIPDWTTANINIYYEGMRNGEQVSGDLERTDNMDEVNLESFHYMVLPVEGNGMAFVVPDELKLTITYMVTLDNENYGNNIQGINTVSMEGRDEISTQDDAEFHVQSDSVETGATDSVRLFKRDADNTSKLLDGSEFQLYAGSDISSGKSSVIVNANGEEITLSEAGTYSPSSETDTSSGRQGVEIKKLEGADYYVLVETKAPTGYLIPDQPVTVFKFGKAPTDEEEPETVTVTVGDKKYEDVPVQYCTNGDSIIVDNKALSYSLPETGGNGTFWLCLLGSVFIMAGGMALLYDRRLEQRRAER